MELREYYVKLMTGEKVIVKATSLEVYPCGILHFSFEKNSIKRSIASFNSSAWSSFGITEEEFIKVLKNNEVS